ncbi:MAG: hypothetical protein AB9869_08135 [Verrucomicrobiia bacterium]
MNPLPSSRESWLRLALLPFQVYVLAAFAAVRVHQHLVHHRHAELSFYFAVLVGYWMTFFVLLVGGFGQRSLGDHRGSATSWLLAAFCIVFAWLVPTPFVK